jgi:hypothetical protein
MPRTATVIFLAALLASACDRYPERPADVEEPPRPAARQTAITDTIMVEGMPEPVTLQLLQSPRDAAIHFSTYVPERLDARLEGGGDTVAVRIAAAFDGTPHPDAWMHIRFYPAGTTVDEAREMLSAFMATRRPEANPLGGRPADDPYQPAATPPWAEEAHAVQYRGEGDVLFLGHVILATRDGRVFHVLRHYPAEYGDGVEPRFDAVLRHWQWGDGSGL